MSMCVDFDSIGWKIAAATKELEAAVRAACMETTGPSGDRGGGCDPQLFVKTVLYDLKEYADVEIEPTMTEMQFTCGVPLRFDTALMAIWGLTVAESPGQRPRAVRATDVDEEWWERAELAHFGWQRDNDGKETNCPVLTVTWRSAAIARAVKEGFSRREPGEGIVTALIDVYMLAAQFNLDGFVQFLRAGGIMATSTTATFALKGLSTSKYATFILMLHPKDDSYREWLAHANSMGLIKKMCGICNSPYKWMGKSVRACGHVVVDTKAIMSHLGLDGIFNYQGSYLCPVGTCTKQQCVGQLGEAECKRRELNINTNVHMKYADILDKAHWHSAQMTLQAALHNAAEHWPPVKALYESIASTLETRTGSVGNWDACHAGSMNLRDLLKWSDGKGVTHTLIGGKKQVQPFLTALRKELDEMNGVHKTYQAVHTSGTRQAKTTARSTLAQALRKLVATIDPLYTAMMSAQYLKHTHTYNVDGYDPIFETAIEDLQPIVRWQEDREALEDGLAEWLVPPALQPQLVQAFEQLTTIHGDLVDVMKIADSTARGEAQHMYLAKVCYAAGHHTPA